MRSPTTTRPGRDADAGGERLAVGCAAVAPPPRHREPGTDRPLGLVLVRRGPAEIGQHAVAHELGDVAVEAGDLAGHSVLVGVEDLAHLLGVEPRAERGRADEVDEHHGELPPLGLQSRRRGGLGIREAGEEGWQRSGQRGDGSQQALAVP